MTPAQFDSIKQYVGFTDESTAVLRSFSAEATQHFEEIIDDFYATIEAHPEAAAAITGGRAQVERLKRTLVRWLDEVLTGPHDVAFLDAHSRIGRVHVRISLPQEFMFTAMNRIRLQLLRVADGQLTPGTADHQAVKRALNMILDLELAIMLDTYREDLVEKMRARERLATLGQLAATIAHELRNPLGTIESSLFLMQKRFDKIGLGDDVIGRHHAKISAQVQECGTTIHNLLDLARDRPVKKQQVAARPLIEATLSALQAPPNVRIENAAAGELVFEADPDQLRQAVSNLVRNAVESVKDQGVVRVSVHRRNEAVTVDVEDDGPGIPKELYARVFDVLFTTKATGTGLGLALARRVAEAHDGTLELLPTERGAHFRITIPQPAEIPADANVS